ncbi:MAG: PD-(D/E)XK nuclease family protein [Acidimicrobiales bacterium]|jgi:putative RecB family exonuclease
MAPVATELDLPSTLSPSKITAFTNCPLTFRFSVIEHLPEPPSPAALKGTLVHRALELLFTDYRAGSRSRSAAQASLDRAWQELRAGVELEALKLDGAETAAFIADARELVSRYFELEDPDTVRAVGLELHVSTDLDGVTVHGIIDRLDELDDGSLVVVDYKTGRAPRSEQSRSRLSGVQMYALMCEAERKVRPAVVRLLYLRDRIVVSATPTDQTMRGTRQRALGVWSAIERACREDDFRPNPSSLCRFCAFQAYCPCFGGDPALAAPALAAPALEAPPLAAPAVAVPALAATVLASPTLEAPGVSSVSLPA